MRNWVRLLLFAVAGLRILSGVFVFTYAVTSGHVFLSIASVFLALGLFSRIAMIATLVLLVLDWQAGQSGLFLPVLICFGSGSNRLSLDRLLRILRGKERSDAGRLPRADALDLYYDGECVFCRRSVEVLRAMDLFGKLRMHDFRKTPADDIDPERAEKELLLRTRERRILGGFYAFREMAKLLPLTMPIYPLLWVPGLAWIGERAYAWVADHRLLLMGKAEDCETGVCSR